MQTRIASTMICVLTALLLCSPARAVYAGVLTSSQPITFALANNAGNAGPNAATICFIVQAAKHSAGSNLICYTLTAQPGAGASQLTVVPPTGSTRVVAEIDAPPGGGPSDFIVSQPTFASYQNEVSVDNRVTFDIQ